MNKFKLVFLSILGGMDVLMRIMTPLILVWVFLAIFGIKGDWTSYVLIILGIGSTMFRAIKIGWMNK